VAANTQLRKLLREFLDLAKCQAIGHQCGGGDDAIRVRLYDGPIYARRESKVVRINHEASHSGSLAGGTSYLLRCGRLQALPVRPEGTGHGDKYTLRSLDASLSRCPADVMRSSIRRADLICPHTVTLFIVCPSWGTDDLQSGDFHPLRSAHVRHSNCDSNIDPEFARRHTCMNIVLGRDLIPC